MDSEGSNGSIHPSIHPSIHVLLIVAGFAWAASAKAQNLVSRPVGFIRIPVSSNTPLLASSPFAGSSGESVLRWSAASQEYVAATSGEIPPGEGFWIEGATSAVFLAGDVVLEPTNTVVLVPALNLVGYPYSTPVRPEDANSLLPDESTWGKGFWYRPDGDECVVWTEVRPYADVFPTNDEPPEITAVEVVGGTSVVLHIRCSGEPTESLDILYQDTSPTQRFDTTTGWRLAAESLSANGESAIDWTDSGSAARLPVTEVVGRYYLVGRADIDLNHNGVPDARERFGVGRGQPAALAASLAEAASVELLGHVETGADSEITSELQASLVTSNATPAASALFAARVIYVDQKTGNDAYSGRKTLVVGADGPKKTIGGGLGTANPGDYLIIRPGKYLENYNVAGRSITVRMEGDVRVSGGDRTVIDAQAPPVSNVSTNR